MTPETQPARSRRERPAKPALTRDGIVATALTVMRAEGLDRVTMRRLAAELDTGPASLYVYLRNTAELHAAMLEELLGQIDLGPVAAPGDWRQRLIEILTAYTAILFEHPGLAQSALVTRPRGPAYFALADGILALLDAGGVPRPRAAWAMDLLLHVATATAVEHGVRERAIDAREEEAAVAAAALRDVDAGRFPHIAAVGATELMSGPGRLDWGFRVLIDGVSHTPRPERETTP